MRAFQEQDHATADLLMADDFVFTSPQDDHLDKDAWFEKCFPSANHFDAPPVTLQILDVGGLVIHRYEYGVGGKRWRNVEALRVRGGRVTDVEVYFGGAVGG